MVVGRSDAASTAAESRGLTPRARAASCAPPLAPDDQLVINWEWYCASHLGESVGGHADSPTGGLA
jgi:hypothetical protein